MPERRGVDSQWHRVLETATRLFADHGFDEVTMAEIAFEADVSRATVFNYFGSKHALIETITEGVLKVWGEMLDEALADETTPVSVSVRKLCELMGKGIESQRPLFRSVFREIARIQLGLDPGEVAQRANERALERMRELVARGQTRGELSTAFSPETLSAAFHSLTHGTITRWLYEDPTAPLTVRMHEAAEVFLSPVELVRPTPGALEGKSHMTNDLAAEYDPLHVDVQADPYPYYAALREDAPVYWLDSLRSFVVSRYDDVRRVMHDNETFSSEAMGALVSRPVEYADAADAADDLDGYDRSDFPKSVVGLDGAAHNRLRMIVNRGFTPRRIGVLETEMRCTARAFIDSLVAAGSGDLQAGLAVPFPTTVIAQLLGVPIEQRDDFRRWSEWMVRGVFEPLDAQQQNEVARAGREMGEYLEAVIDRRSDGRGDDLISVLLDAEPEGGALTPQELEVFVFTLLVVGSITTAYLIGRAAELLAADPALLASIRTDRSQVSALVEETLRYDPPVQLMFRTATADVEIAGTTIPSRSTVIALLGSANRDPSVFRDPDRFDSTRNSTEHLSFGHGVHFCMGVALARLEARLALEELLEQAATLEPAGDAERVSSIVFRGPTSLPLRFR